MSINFQNKITGDTALHESIYHEDIHTAKSLLKNGANPNIYNFNEISKTPLIIATEKKNLKLVELLLENGGNPNLQIHSNGNTCCHIAAYNNNKEILDILIKYNGDVNIKNNYGYTVKNIIDNYFK